ncbi:MAG: response regulator transcription factor [Chloroflexi bacterium]|nr:MAG: response regulator transcription factor [Chloroflexota bacterium]
MSSALSALSGTSAAPTRGARILLIDDEPGILDFVSRGLQAEGYVVATAVDAGSGLRAALSQAYDLIILDLLLPDRGGVDVLRDIVAKLPGQPVIVLSALVDTSSKVTSFEVGAEDYLAKPFSLDELLARIRVRLRDARSRPTRLTAGSLILDLISRQAQGESGRVQLAEREFLLLRELMSSAGETVSKERLLATVWGYRFDPGSNVVDVYVRRLRAKIGGEAIKTVRGEGYRVDAG